MSRQKPQAGVDGVSAAAFTHEPSKVETDRDLTAAEALELQQLRAENDVMRAREHAIVDAMAEMQESIDALKAGQVGAAAAAVAKHDAQAEMDAELAELLEAEKSLGGYGLIDVFERRALVGVDANLEIRLKDDPSVVDDPFGERCRWKLRWFNFEKEGRSQQATAEGYEKVRWEDLADQEMITGGTREDGYVRKGSRGKEVLCKIPLKLYAHKKKRDAMRQQGQLQSESAVRDLAANRVAARIGAQGGNADEAGSFIANKRFSVEVTQGATERFTA